MALMSRGLLFSKHRRGLADPTAAVLCPTKIRRHGGRPSRVDALLRVFTLRAGGACAVECGVSCWDFSDAQIPAECHARGRREAACLRGALAAFSRHSG